MIRVKRVYQPPAPGDGARYLVERLWPRGFTRDALALNGWLKDVAPSQDLRKWFGHDPARWQEFSERYTRELESNPDAWQPLLDAARRGNVTLLFSARDTERNSAVLLKSFLDKHLG